MLAFLLAAALVKAAPRTAPTLKQLRSATVGGIYEGTAIHLRGGSYKGKPDGANRPHVELMANLTATGDLDGNPGDERVALLSRSDGDGATRVYVAVFALRDRKVENVATILVGAQIQSLALATVGRTIELDVVELGPTDFPCCPTRPARRAYWLQSSGLKAFADVPFELIHDRIVLRASVGSVQDLQFLLDTGTEKSTIDQEVAARAGHATPDAFMIAGLRIGIEDVEPFDVDVADLSSTSRAFGREIGGVLGNDVLRSRILQIDYSRRRLRFLPDAPYAPPDALTRPMTFVEGGHVPRLEDVVTVNGKAVPVALDTGSASALEIFPSARELLGAGLWKTKDKSGHAHVDSLAVGGVAIAPQQVALPDRPGPTASSLGRLGNPGLAPFVLTLNYRDGRLVLAKP